MRHLGFENMSPADYETDKQIMLAVEHVENVA
jgi:hypothetical protein